MRLTMEDGTVVTADLRNGFAVNNQDGTGYQIVHMENLRIVSGPPLPPGGGGEPMPVEGVA